jgi:hypothetical protein
MPSAACELAIAGSRRSTQREEGPCNENGSRDVQPTNVADTNCSHGPCRAGLSQDSALQAGARLVALDEAEMSWLTSSFPTRCLFSVAFPRTQTWQRQAASARPLMTGGGSASGGGEGATEVSPDR